MKKIFLTLALCAALGAYLPFPAQAQLKSDSFTKYSQEAFKNVYETDPGNKLEKSLPAAIGNVISIALSFIGVILLVILVYAGFLWLTAGGNEEQVGRAKKLIKNGIIGLTISLAAYLITSFVVQQVQQSVGAQASTTTGPPTKVNK